jgi:endo-1,4-beta-mannosidase
LNLENNELFSTFAFSFNLRRYKMARFVKQLDPNHLLTTGEEGFYSLGTQGSEAGAHTRPLFGLS